MKVTIVKRIRVLIIDDSEDDRQRFLNELSKSGYVVEHERVDGPERLEEELSRDSWDLVISEYHLERLEGPDALRMTRAWDDDLPFLMVSNIGGEQRVVESMRAGANDFLSKTDLSRLIPAVERELAEATIRRERKEAIRKLKVRERRLRKALSDREILLREVHHRVKNNFQVIISLLAMQMLKVEDPSLRSVFQDSQNRIKAMALIHEHLYGSKDISEIDFSAYLRNLITVLHDSFCRDEPRIDVSVSAEPVMLDLDQAIQCGLLLNEILTNAFKHAFPDTVIRTPRIEVQVAQKNPDRIRLRVTDNGVGMSEQINPDQSDSVGLRMIHLLARDLNDGTLRLDRSDGTGYTITFSPRNTSRNTKTPGSGPIRAAG